MFSSWKATLSLLDATVQGRLPNSVDVLLAKVFLLNPRLDPLVLEKDVRFKVIGEVISSMSMLSFIDASGLITEVFVLFFCRKDNLSLVIDSADVFNCFFKLHFLVEILAVVICTG